MATRRRISISLSDKENEVVEAEARKVGLKKSTFIKSVLIKHINKKTKTK